MKTNKFSLIPTSDATMPRIVRFAILTNPINFAA